MRRWILAMVMCVLMLGFAGCEPLRFAPSEPQKQMAWLTAELAKEVDAEGTVPGSPAAEKLVEGTRVAAYYYGPPKVPADMSQFDTIAPVAQKDAQERPDAWALADNALELAIGISALLGGVYGSRAVKYLSTARQKSKALEQIVKGNELFKNAKHHNGASLITDEQKNRFKIVQDEKQTPETKILVATIKASA